MRALRLLHRHLPHLPTAGRRTDGPRGRIYLIKQVLEGHEPTRKTQLHLDRCLTCRSCETTCPSGVQYGHLIDIGRKLVDAKVQRPLAEKAVRWALKEGLPSPLFGPAMHMGQMVRGLLPESIKKKVPAKQPSGAWPTREHARKVLMLAGCVQPSMSPNINTATARVLDAAGIQTIVPKSAGCCGALKFHLNDHDGGKAHMRTNIDAWWPYVQAADTRTASSGGKPNNASVEAIIMNASGCGVTVKEYGHILRDDPAYADKAARISALTKDISELLPDIVTTLKTARPELTEALKTHQEKLVFHPPCTLQHGQQLKGGVEKHLGELGFNVQLASCDAHLCCGSAGTYSVLQPELSTQLRDRKLGNLQACAPTQIISANIGCITHLQSGTETPVRHWVEVLDAALA